MPKNEDSAPGEGQHPYVDRLRGDPSEPPRRVRVLAGLPGDSDRPGFTRIYFTKDLKSYAEFKADDVVYTEPVPADQPPSLGMEATRVGVGRDAAIDFVRTRGGAPVDEWDLDVRLAPRAAGAAPLMLDEPETWEAECPGPYWFA